MSTPTPWCGLSLNQRLARLKKEWPDKEESELMGMAGLPHEPPIAQSSGYDEMIMVVPHGASTRISA